MSGSDLALDSAIARAARHSPFLSNLIEREAELMANIAVASRDPLGSARVNDPDMPLPRRLRIERRRLALAAAIGDMSGQLDFVSITRNLSDFADYALDAAIGAAIVERVPGGEPRGLAGIALGKQGSHELNYSSDIDPILIFDPATLPHRERDAVEEAAVRIGRRVVEILQARDADGYVLRIDLRLRPSPEVTPIVLPAEAAISYYESQALPWERAAFIRSRAAAGDCALGQGFLDTIRPFVWRRAVDFGTIREIRGISRRIRDHHAQGQAFGPGFDLKRGRGGIREVEFFAQIHQLIHGGRDPALRAPATLDALAALAAAGRIDAEEARQLREAYILFRTIEHRVQMVDDRQTHSLPHGEALDGVARLHGLDDGGDLLDLLRPHVEAVGRIYDALDSEDGGAGATGAAVGEAGLAEAGFADPAGATRLIEGWRSGRYAALRSPPARAAMEAALPPLIAAIGQSPDPGAALARLDTILSRLPTALNLFHLLEARPTLARLLGTILSHAPTLADALARRVDLLDGLIDASALAPVGPVAELAKAMTQREAGDDYQRLLDHVRQIVGEKRFALGAQIVAGAGDPLEVSAGYARVAEAALAVLAQATVEEFAVRHGRVPGSELVILALGRFGGGALTHASDLDLVFVFTGDHLGESDGEKPLGAVTYYNRLAQRVIAALSVATAAGALYEVDTRLRPSGAQGPLVVSLEGFARYQREEAWTWEHMALTRARAVFGSPTGRGAVVQVIDQVLHGDRPARDIAAEAAKMRADMAAHKPPKGPLDAKLLPGGLVDLEFAVHTLQLVRRTGFAPGLRDAVDALVADGLLPATIGPAHDFLTRLLVTMRLVAPDAQPPGEATRAMVAHAVGAAEWNEVVASLDRHRQEVATAWAGVARAQGS
ncbi:MULTISPECIES: bifunctional [glutamate--ammonia ligase]-adenylyl-L-tyrosine phosphorylase/[glutamate--ammonia-ligase] adenylyltransferase [unclassified Sphingomonas]|uniref:bifunctional [glutamate--ammonia ligase]-adenylyl-L-tyrosine phosphorylase/[glutamate--ammonia-ligase] adenylyltransferase n=1 Tax=unclassified Sphingomonas TaxID=196159 RepID=UPI002151F5F0|nr:MULTISPECIES: bifunctional [glutamate--ammonia ligase]-adenylyl-L-tyrosine phosphorylase/[glutamate--ammonia-ligase] adenylyltransferase [unclassified Sphingomonas]MCR5871747.1 bifunctional [glutamate--ammonia ligase]-adenylyl-L-tyrosine phosphorylase/[glutamate--ammonia-ligase] adenylyltransferase [Sphingomonas sp. J344]UUX99966.1 bifunctional [glutamate--ammonia ligase]-adenylyl-L-tyrosine phosphorylase/[glutamate--ammonia-ligase] adenylyltransferase [Sphingomonas sp. J315]